MQDKPYEITVLLRRLRRGDGGPADRLLRVVYEELRRIARAHARKEVTGHVLRTTALIHEAWLRLADQTRVDWRDRTHIKGVAAQMMRRVPADHARARLTDKRGAGAGELSLDWVEIEATRQKLNPFFSPGFVARRCRPAWIQAAQPEGAAGVLDSTSRRPTERKAVDMQ